MDPTEVSGALPHPECSEISKPRVAQERTLGFEIFEIYQFGGRSAETMSDDPILSRWIKFYPQVRSEEIKSSRSKEGTVSPTRQREDLVSQIPVSIVHHLCNRALSLARWANKNDGQHTVYPLAPTPECRSENASRIICGDRIL